MATLSAAPVVAENALSVVQAEFHTTPVNYGTSDIKSPGTVVVLQQDGVDAIPAGGMFTRVPENKVIDGQLKPLSKIDLYLTKDMNRSSLKSGEKMYVVKIEGRTDNKKNDILRFQLITCEQYDVGEAKKRYSAVVGFYLPKGTLDGSSPQELEKTVAGVLAADSEGGGDEKPAETQRASSAKPQQAASAPAQAAQPAAPAQQPTATVNMGMSPDQVVGALGQPMQIIDLGAKKTYKYKDMKVIFVNNKVSDVQ